VRTGGRARAHGTPAGVPDGLLTMSGATTATTAKSRIHSGLIAALWFGLAGPAIGTLIFAAWGSLASDSSTTTGVSILAGLWMLPFAYLLGLVPAALAGLVTGFFGRDLGTASFVALGVAVGATAMGLVGIFDGAEAEVTEGVINLAIMGGLAGGSSGALSRVFSPRERAGDRQA
jgi:hypothetical protein